MHCGTARDTPTWFCPVCKEHVRSSSTAGRRALSQARSEHLARRHPEVDTSTFPRLRAAATLVAKPRSQLRGKSAWSCFWCKKALPPMDKGSRDASIRLLLAAKLLLEPQLGDNLRAKARLCEPVQARRGDHSPTWGMVMTRRLANGDKARELAKAAEGGFPLFRVLDNLGRPTEKEAFVLAFMRTLDACSWRPGSMRRVNSSCLTSGTLTSWWLGAVLTALGKPSTLRLRFALAMPRLLAALSWPLGTGMMSRMNPCSLTLATSSLLLLTRASWCLLDGGDLGPSTGLAPMILVPPSKPSSLSLASATTSAYGWLAPLSSSGWATLSSALRATLLNPKVSLWWLLSLREST